MALLGILISRPVLRMMAAPEEILDRSTLYMQIYCAGIPLVIFYNFGSSILRAAGSSFLQSAAKYSAPPPTAGSLIRNTVC